MTDYVSKAKQLEAELSESDDGNLPGPSRRRRRVTRRPNNPASRQDLTDEPIVKKAVKGETVRKPKLECSFCRAKFSQRLAPLFREHLQACVLKQVERSREFLDSSVVDFVRSKYASSTRRKRKPQLPTVSNSEPSCSGVDSKRMCSDSSADGLKYSEYFADQDTNDASAAEDAESDDDEDETICAFCGKSMATWNVERRAVHSERCAVADEKAARAEVLLRDMLVDTAQRAILPCPLCEERTKSAAQRKLHIKKCAAHHHVPFDHLLVLVRNQERAFIARLNELSDRPGSVVEIDTETNSNDTPAPASSAAATNVPDESTGKTLRIPEILRLLDENGVQHKPVDCDPITGRYRITPKPKPKPKPKTKEEPDLEGNNNSNFSNATNDTDDVIEITPTPVLLEMKPNLSSPLKPLLTGVKSEVPDSTSTEQKAEYVAATVAEPIKAEPLATVELTLPTKVASAASQNGSVKTLVQTKLAVSGAGPSSSKTSASRAAYRALVREEANKLRMMSRLEQLLMWNSRIPESPPTGQDNQPTVVTINVTSNSEVRSGSHEPLVAMESASVFDRLDVSVSADNQSYWQFASLGGCGSEPAAGWFAPLPCFVPFTMLHPNRIPGRWDDVKVAEARQRKLDALKAKAPASAAAPEAKSSEKRTCEAADCVLFGSDSKTVPSSAEPFLSLARQMANLIDDAASADANIVFSSGTNASAMDVTLPVHTAVLAARCPPLLQRVLASPDRVWRIDSATCHIEPQSMRFFIEYVYCAHECPVIYADSRLLEQFYRIVELVHLEQFESLLNRRVSVGKAPTSDKQASSAANVPATAESPATVSVSESPAIIDEIIFDAPSPGQPPSADVRERLASPPPQTGPESSTSCALKLAADADPPRTVSPVKKLDGSVSDRPVVASPSYILSSDSDEGELPDVGIDRNRDADTIFTQLMEPSSSPASDEEDVGLNTAGDCRTSPVDLPRSSTGAMNADSPIIIESDSESEAVGGIDGRDFGSPSSSLRKRSMDLNFKPGSCQLASTAIPLRRLACERARACDSPGLSIGLPQDRDVVPNDLPSVLDVTCFDRTDSDRPIPTPKSILRQSTEKLLLGREKDRLLECEGDSQSPIFAKRRKKLNGSKQRDTNANTDSCASSSSFEATGDSLNKRSVRRSNTHPSALSREEKRLPDDSRSTNIKQQTLVNPESSGIPKKVDPVSVNYNVPAPKPSSSSASVHTLTSRTTAVQNQRPTAISKKLDDSDDDLPPPFSEVVQQMLQQPDQQPKKTAGKAGASSVISMQQRNEAEELLQVDFANSSALFSDWDIDPELTSEVNARISPKKQQSPNKNPTTRAKPASRGVNVGTFDSDAEMDTIGDGLASPTATPAGHDANASNYSMMDTPCLQKELARFGLKKLARRKALLVLRDIRSRMRNSGQRHARARRSVERAARTLQKAKQTQAHAAATAALTLTPSGSVPKAKTRKFVAKRRSNKALFNNSQSSEDSAELERRQVVEESIMFSNLDDEEEESESDAEASKKKTSPSKKTSSPSKKTSSPSKKPKGEGKKAKEDKRPVEVVIREAVLDCLRNDEAFYLRILAFEAIAIEEFQERLRVAEIRCGEQRLINILDEQCITFSLRNHNSFLHRNRDRNGKRNARAQGCSQAEGRADDY